jgi:hypothetical protein
MDDFETIRRAYRSMLQHPLNEVPNTRPYRSALGSISNGGHTDALLLAGVDAFTMDHYRSFFFAEGASRLAAKVM